MNEAELLFTEVLNCDRASLYLNKDLSLDKDKSLFISGVLEKRANGQPLQYILGKTDFMGLTFKVDERVLIPRPETEGLVEAAARVIDQGFNGKCGVLDIGTGSGCIAVSLAKIFPGINIHATDISPEALEVAVANAQAHGVSGRINFSKADLFPARDLIAASYDIIISNPPYIASGDIGKLQPEVRREPRVALDGGQEGLDLYRRIIKEAPAYLNKGGSLIMEIGFGQRPGLEKIIEKSGIFAIIEWVSDYNNIDRVVVIKRAR